MEHLSDTIKAELINKAKRVCKNSYSPYSHLAVGAAVLTEDDKIFTGVNIENASYGLTICAERIALGNAITNGKLKIKAIAIYSSKPNITPCGTCRQFIREFGAEIVVVYLENDIIVSKTINQLLPNAFTEKKLK